MNKIITLAVLSGVVFSPAAFAADSNAPVPVSELPVSAVSSETTKAEPKSQQLMQNTERSVQSDVQKFKTDTRKIEQKTQTKFENGLGTMKKDLNENVFRK